MGVLVLGAIDPGEREEVETHVRTCRSCAAKLAPLPGLLKRVDASYHEAPAAPPGILDRALEQIRAQEPADLDAARRRRRPRIAWLAAGVAAVTVLIAGLAGVRTAGVFPFSAPTTVVAAAANPTTGVSASVTLQPSDAGTRVLLALSGVAPGAHCQLVAVGKDGQREVAATWVASYDGEAHVAGITGLPTHQIAAFDITTPQGSTLVSVPLPV
jgi:anti-sigma factor RsiW